MASNGGSHKDKKKPWYEIKEDDDDSAETPLARVIKVPKKEIDSWALMRSTEFWEEVKRQKDLAAEASVAAANRMGIDGVPPNETGSNQEGAGGGGIIDEGMQLDETQRIQVERSGELGGHQSTNEMPAPQVRKDMLQLSTQLASLTTKTGMLVTQVGALTNHVETLNSHAGINGVQQEFLDGQQNSSTIDQSHLAPSSTLFSATGTPPSPPQVSAGPAKMKCGFCPRAFVYASALHKHMQQCHAGDHGRDEEATQQLFAIDREDDEDAGNHGNGESKKKKRKYVKKETGSEEKSKKNVKPFRITGPATVYF